jgi:hypothetical protein
MLELEPRRENAGSCRARRDGSDAHSMILAICMEMPVEIQHRRMLNIPVSQARPSTTTSTSASNARRNASSPSCPTMWDAASTSASVSAGIVSIGRTRPAEIAFFTSARGTSDATTAMRKASPSSRAISRTISNV